MIRGRWRWRGGGGQQRQGACRTRSGSSGGYAHPWRNAGFGLQPLPSRLRCFVPAGLSRATVAGAARTGPERAGQHRPPRDRCLVLVSASILFSPSSPRSCWCARARAGAAGILVARRDRDAAQRSRSRQRPVVVGTADMVDWPAASDEPSIDGDPAIVGASAPHRVLAFGSWLDAGKARPWSRPSRLLRTRGEAFAMTLTTLAGQPIEAQGRAIGGRAVLRLKDASGVKRDLVDLVAPRILRTEVTSLRSLIEALPSPVWTRDAAGQLTSSIAAYARAVEAKDAADAVERGIWNCSTAPRARSHRAGASPRRRLCRPASRHRRRHAANLRCARFQAPRPAAPASASTPPKRNDALARWPASPMRIAARSISSRPASPCSTPTSG
jgi:hypothetical protein